jgi:hypothetical protein
MAIGTVSAYQAGGETQGTKREYVTTSNQEKMFNYGATESDKNIELQVEREEDKTARKGAVEVVTGQDLPNMGLKDVAPLNKGLGEIITGKDFPDMGLKDVAPPNKGLLQLIIDWFKN